MSARFTGKAAQNAMAKPTARLHHKSKSPSPASIAPGTSNTKPLSTSYLTAIETVSAANATRVACRSETPFLSSGRSVSE
jgi:hypothetical protein